MSKRKIVYLVIDAGTGSERESYWKPAGYAYLCRDNSINLKLDLFPNLIFNIRDPKSNSEVAETQEK